MGVLIYVQKCVMPVTSLMISSFFGISKPSVTDMVNSLIKKNYLVKTPSMEDRRSYTLEVTLKGRELVEEAHNEYFKAMELLEEEMGPEEFQLLVKLLQKANKVLSEERE